MSPCGSETTETQGARRLMLGQNLDATSAAYRKNFDDASYFNRVQAALWY